MRSDTQHIGLRSTAYKAGARVFETDRLRSSSAGGFSQWVTKQLVSAQDYNFDSSVACPRL